MRARNFGIGMALISVIVGLSGCTTPKPPPEITKVPKGLAAAVNNCATLVPVRSTTTAGGIREQDLWISQRYPGAVKISQSLVECGNTPVDVIGFRQNGVDRTVLFDISSFFGRVGTDDLDDMLDG